MNRPSLLLTAPLLKGGNRHLHIVKELVALANVIVHANHIIQIVNQKSWRLTVRWHRAEIKVWLSSEHCALLFVFLKKKQCSKKWLFCLNPIAFCDEMVDTTTCKRSEKKSNYIFYDPEICTCIVFASECLQEENVNMFVTFEECQQACPVDPENCSNSRKWTHGECVQKIF